jgi:hypothetical protein
LDLQDLLDPKEKQKIYLVAAGYEPDVLSACAWLRQHDIEIACFQLRPYRVGGQLLLERDRLIPPPQLDDFLVEMRSDDEKSVNGREKDRVAKSDRASELIWEDDQGNPQAVSTWKEALVYATTKALKLGLAVDKLPMPHDGDGQNLRSPVQIESNLHVEAHASAELIRNWLSKLFQRLGKPKGFLRVVTKSGNIFDLPET